MKKYNNYIGYLQDGLATATQLTPVARVHGWQGTGWGGAGAGAGGLVVFICTFIISVHIVQKGVCNAEAKNAKCMVGLCS